MTPQHMAGAQHMAGGGDLASQMRPAAARLTPYDPAFSAVEVNLSANENTHGMPEEVRAAVDRAVSKVATNRYPAPLATELRAQIAEWHGLGSSQVIVGNGGDELLFNLMLAYGGSGHAMVDCPPTFSVYRLYGELAETEVVDVPRDPRTYAIDVNAVVEAARSASLVMLTSPNNPTGNLVDVDAVAQVCEACPGVVLVDEAYGEFAAAGTSAEALLGTYDNLAVLHTFSKAYCLAGARMGYVLASPEVVRALAAVRQPYSVNSLSQAAASVVVAARDQFAPVIEQVKADREELRASLSLMSEMGVLCWPSEGNFLLVRVPDAHRMWERLRDEHSILVRDFSATRALEGCLRVTVGTTAENDRLIRALTTILREGSTTL